jgi:hypothetical protein
MTSVLALLFGPDGDARQALRAHLPPLPPIPGVDDLPARVAAALQELLAVPVGHLALGAWATHRRVREAREQTARQPGSRQVVALAEHTVHSEEHPVIDLDVGVGGASQRLLALTLDVAVEVSAVSLVISHGQIAEVLPAAASGAARLMAGSTCLARGSLTTLDLRTPGDEGGSP